jgi:hypothetical protein
MKVFLPLAILLLALNAYAEFDTELSGNVEGQIRNSTNNPEAKDPPLFQDWDNENFYLVYGNLNGKVEMGKSRFEANWFVRYTKSELYDPKPTPLGPRDPYLATQIFTFPNTLVARDIFQLQRKDQSGDHQTESVLNKFYYEMDLEENRIMFGRMYVNYGLGEIFNPINPFNQPTALTSISQVAQGNDGVSFTYFASDDHTVQFLLLGDKKVEGYDGQIDWTLWAHGEYQATSNLQLDYVIGQDQNRNKLGGQVTYKFEEAMVFTQLLYQSQLVNVNEDSNNLFDALLGYDQQLTNKWHVRLESGYQKQNRYALTSGFGDRFLPSEYFVALANVYEVHPLFKVSATIVNDIKSGFTYLIGKGTLDLGHSMEAELFGFAPVGKGDEADNLAQKLVTTDVGLAIRAFF